MRSLLAALLLGLGFFSLPSEYAMAYSLVRTRSWAAQTIPNGDNVLPVAGVNIPKRASVAQLQMSRASWPLVPVTLSIEITFDGGLTWEVCAGPLDFVHGVPDPRTGVLYPADFECGWNADRKAPDAGRLHVINPDAAFSTDITLNFYDTD